MNETVIHLCSLCGGNGLNPRHPKALDTKAGKHTKDMLCPVCRGSGYNPEHHPDKVAEFTV